MNTNELIGNNFNGSIKEFVESNGYDLDTYNNLLSGKTKGNRVGTKAYELKQFLILNGLYEDAVKKEELEVDLSKVKNISAKNFLLLEFNKEKNSTLKEIFEYFCKMIPCIIRLYYKQSVREYLDIEYYKDKNINEKDFSQFVIGKNIGAREKSKPYYIKQKLQDDGILPIITIKK